jgi:hypothetical protein
MAEAFGIAGHELVARARPTARGIARTIRHFGDTDLLLESFRIERFDGWNGVAEPIALHG